MKILSVLGLLVCVGGFANAEPTAADRKFYRDLTHKLSRVGTFSVTMAGTHQKIHFEYDLAKPIYAEPIIADARVGLDPRHFYRNFWDRIFLTEGSYLDINGRREPLTCIFINGQDNRYAGLSDPRIPTILMRIYLVARDKTCTGPLNPNYPQDGTVAENWDTYMYYELKHPETLFPTGSRIRTNWNDIFIDPVGWY
ncbi:hypothetical protein [Bdellovibrio sp. HCB337]|uniref:hypothetical protein n=1 Tax=Bdellovibrio sp. HCB337 TaxID=3394358 RepID=UPI0039A6FC5B